jgi:cell division cycle protein 37
MLNYADFTKKHEDLLETYCNLTGMTALKAFLLTHGEILLQEHASSYLLLSCLEDEMNGEREKMKNTARNSQILTNMAELAKSLKRHPGNVIVPFFTRVEEPEHEKAFLEGVQIFVDRIIKRAVEKRKEMDAEQETETEEVDLSSIPKEEVRMDKSTQVPCQGGASPQGLSKQHTTNPLPNPRRFAAPSRFSPSEARPRWS